MSFVRARRGLRPVALFSHQHTIQPESEVFRRLTQAGYNGRRNYRKREIAMTDSTKDLRNVIVFALADGDFNDDERAFVANLAGEAGIGQEELARLTAEAEAGGQKLSLPRDADKARRAIELLAGTAAVDGVVSDKERRMLMRIARRLEIEDTIVEEMIGRALAGATVDESEVESRLEDIYAHFNSWDGATRAAKLDEFAHIGRQAVEPLLRLLESYRVPDGAENALELKRLVVEKLGDLGDGRAAYYLVQQVSIGDLDDEITCGALRCAAAGALGKITGKGFTADQAGVAAVRAWWASRPTDRAQYDKLTV